MKKLQHYSISDYLDHLAKREPVPGGGSAAALSGALGAALISMVTRYTIGKSSSKRIENRLKSILKESEAIRRRFTQLVDLDAKAYLKVVQARKKYSKDKKRAESEAKKVPQEIVRLCYKAIKLTPFLVEKGNIHLINDVEISVELLFSSYCGAAFLLH